MPFQFSTTCIPKLIIQIKVNVVKGYITCKSKDDAIILFYDLENEIIEHTQSIQDAHDTCIKHSMGHWTHIAMYHFYKVLINFVLVHRVQIGYMILIWVMDIEER